MFKVNGLKTTLLLVLLMVSLSLYAQSSGEGLISGRVISGDKNAVSYATVKLKGTGYGSATDDDGLYHVKAPAGKYTLVVSAVGYETVEKDVTLRAGERIKMNIRIREEAIQLDEVSVVSAGVSRVRNSAYNAVAIDTRDMLNTTKSLSEALAKAPGLKLRESGGVGSDMNLMLDGFSGKHVKVFIDGVPQEGVGSSFGLNNIPVNFADRIEVYKGVVPVGFGTDAIGGVINIVTNRKPRKWFLDAGYSYGSFNTHKSHVNFGQTFKNGFTYEINAFQNYSDNDYWVDAQVYDFSSGVLPSTTTRVKRFNDIYHNEAVVAKVGFVGKSWADRLMLGFTYSHMYQDVQTGVRQYTVFGEKHRFGHSLMPSIEYSKRDLIIKGLSVVATANYNRNTTTNVDTASYEYNWLGERRRKTTSAGEQSYQLTRSVNDNWNATVTVNYRISKAHTLTFNNVFNSFSRENTSLLYNTETTDPISKDSRKDIAGLSYRFLPSEKWNVSVFGKYYSLYVAGPVAVDANASDYVRSERSLDSWGYGVAGSYFILPGLQAKVSYEKAYRLPTVEEMFGDEDLESGSVELRPESSHNVNVNLSYQKAIGLHSMYLEGGFIYRDTRDYIQRSINQLTGNREGASYSNYGKVKTLGYNFSLRYAFSRWLSVGGNFTQMNMKDNEPIMTGTTSVANPLYRTRMPNVPYQFADWDVNFYWHGLGGKKNVLTVTYDAQYTHEFCYYSEGINAANMSDYMVPTQLAHNLTFTYSISGGRYNVSFECRNFTDEKLYDNFSLQKAGRAFYGTFRVSL